MNSHLFDIPERIFVTGTDTGVGKTVVSALLCSGLSAGYWKPVQAGTEAVTDREQVQIWSGLPDNHFYRETYCLSLPASPHLAAKKEDIVIDIGNFHIPDTDQKHLIIEGAGGLKVPLNDRDMIIDLIRRLHVPVLLVCRSGLGTINHTLLSIQALQQQKIDLFGVVMNGPRHESNEEAIRHFGRVNRLFTLPVFREMSPDSFLHQFRQTFLTAHAS